MDTLVEKLILKAGIKQLTEDLKTSTGSLETVSILTRLNNLKTSYTKVLELESTDRRKPTN